MTVIFYLPAFVALVGLVIYLAASSAKVAEVGRIIFFVGTFVAMFLFAGGVHVAHR